MWWFILTENTTRSVKSLPALLRKYYQLLRFEEMEQVRTRLEPVEKERSGVHIRVKGMARALFMYPFAYDR